MSFLDSLDPEIRADYDRMEERRTQMFALSPHYSQVKRIIGKNTGHFSYYSTYDYSITATVIIDNISEITSYLKELSACDWHIIKNTTTNTSLETTDRGWRWTLTKEVRDGLVIKLRLDGDVPYHYGEGTPDTCHRVQVGSETREVPIWKVVCPDGGEDDMTHLDNEMSEEPEVTHV
jgi:hypothetical protein